MAKQDINIGTVANDGTGDTLRVAFGKVNANTAELYSDKADATHAHVIADVSDLAAAYPPENGFVDRTETTLSFNDGTRTLTLAPVDASFTVWAGGQKWVKASAQTVQIANTEGLHWCYFNTSGVLTSATSMPTNIVSELAMVAVVYWDATNSAHIRLNEERHGRNMPWSVHQYLHFTTGTAWASGLGLTDIIAGGNGSLAAHAQFGIADGVIYDEDIRVAIANGAPQTLSTVAQCPIFYRSGTGTAWRRIAPTGYCVTTTGSGRAAYNQNNGGTWQLTEVGSTNHVLMHVVATTDLAEPMVLVMGQATYTSTANARAAATTELTDLALGGFSEVFPEWRPVATIIVQTGNYSNAVKSRIVAQDDGSAWIDWRMAGRVI